MLVVGDLMLDRYVAGSATRISPESPVPVVQAEREWACVGGAANVAANVVALGAGCDLVGCVGVDDAGRELLERLRALGVGVEGVLEMGDRPTTVKTRILAGHQQVVRVDRESTEDLRAEAARQLREAAIGELAGCASVVLEDYDKGVLVPELTRSVLAAAKAEGVPSIVDPKHRRFFGYASATIFKPNLKELEDAFGEPVRPEDAGWMEAARSRLDCEHLLVTLGGRGMSLCSGGEGTTLVPAAAQPVFDVSGAGDTVTAVVALAVALGGTIADAAALANHAAAVQVSKPGVTTVSRDELCERPLSAMKAHG